MGQKMPQSPGNGVPRPHTGLHPLEMQCLLVSFFIYANEQEADGRSYTPVLVLIGTFIFCKMKVISLTNTQAMD